MDCPCESAVSWVFFFGRNHNDNGVPLMISRQSPSLAYLLSFYGTSGCDCNYDLLSRLLSLAGHGASLARIFVLLSFLLESLWILFLFHLSSKVRQCPISFESFFELSFYRVWFIFHRFCYHCLWISKSFVLPIGRLENTPVWLPLTNQSIDALLCVRLLIVWAGGSLFCACQWKVVSARPSLVFKQSFSYDRNVNTDTYHCIKSDALPY